MMASRRTFLATLITGMLTPLRASVAQPTARVARVGWLAAGEVGSPTGITLNSFREGMREAGWVEGQNLAFELRYGRADGSESERQNALAQLATKLVNLKVDVIVASIAPAAFAAKRVVHTVPVVFVGVSDPVDLGLVAGLSKPGRKRHGYLPGIRRSESEATGAAQGGDAGHGQDRRHDVP